MKSSSPSRPELPDGFQVPVHRSVTQPLLVAGLPRALAYGLWTLTFACVFGLRQYWVLAIAAGLHALFAAIAKREPHFVEIVRRALRNQRRLDP
jgi:type IV secretion system protein VirB3